MDRRGERRRRLEEVARSHGMLVIYLFGSRAADGVALLDGRPVAAEGSDLDLGVLLRRPAEDPFREYGELYADFAELFLPLRVDVVLLHEVDPFIQEAAIRGIEIFCADGHSRDLYELEAMRRVGDLLPIQRRLEREIYGSTNR